METREHVDLVKMAITAMMVTMVLGAMFSLFYFVYTAASKKSSEMQDTITSSSTEKLSDLCNATNSGDMPWVTSVINALSEVEDTNLLYVQVIDNSSGDQLYFTYPDVTLTGVSASLVRQVELPLDEASKYLLGYTNCRCGVQYLTDNAVTDSSTLKFDCLQITVLPS